MTQRRSVRVLATLVVTGLCLAYIVWKIDVGRRSTSSRDADYWYFVGCGRDHDRDRAADGVALAAAARGAVDRRPARLADARVLRRLHGRAGAADRRRRRRGADLRDVAAAPGRGGPIAGSVLLERALGGAATLALAAVGFVLAIGDYDVGAYLWIELAFVVATVVLAVALFSRAARRPLARTRAAAAPAAARAAAPRRLRGHPRLPRAHAAAGRRLRADARHPGRARARDLAARARRSASTSRRGSYYVMGPLLFLVMLVPFTINGLAVREAFFVSFLGQLGVAADAAFATGFLFFVVTIALSLPGRARSSPGRAAPPRARPSGMADRSGHVQVPDPGSALRLTLGLERTRRSRSSS